MSEEMNSMLTKTQLDVIPDGTVRRGSYFFGGSRVSADNYWLAFLVGSFANNQTGGSPYSIDTSVWNVPDQKFFVKLTHNKLYKYPAYSPLVLNTPVPFDRRSYLATYPIGTFRAYPNCQSKYTVAIDHETTGSTQRVVFPIPETADIFNPNKFLGVGVTFYVRQKNDPKGYVALILGAKVPELTTETQTAYYFTVAGSPFWTVLGVAPAPLDYEAVLFECLPAMEPLPLMGQEAEVISTTPTNALSGFWSMTEMASGIKITSNYPDAVAYKDDSSEGKVVVSFMGQFGTVFKITTTGQLNSPPFVGDYFVSPQFKGRISSFTTGATALSYVLTFDPAVYPVTQNTVVIGPISDWFLSSPSQVTSLTLDQPFDAVDYDFRLSCVEAGATSMGHVQLWSCYPDSIERHFPIKMHQIGMGVDVSVPYFLGGTHKTYKSTHSVGSYLPPRILSAPLDGDLGLYLYRSGTLDTRISHLSIIPEEQADQVDPSDPQHELVVRHTNAVSNAVPRGVGIMYDGQYAPPGYKEVVGEVNEGADGTFGIPDKTAIRVPLPDNASVAYDKTKNITELRFDYGSANFPQDLFEEDEYFEWDLQHKSVNVSMLPEPDPTAIKISIPFLGFKVKFNMGKLPKMPPRPQRKFAAPTGCVKPKWFPGCQLFTLSESDLGTGTNWVAKAVNEKITAGAWEQFFAATVVDLELQQQKTYKEDPTYGTGTYPQHFPSSLIEHTALIIKHLVSKWAPKWGRSAGKHIAKWANKIAGRRDPLPNIIVDTSSITVFMRLAGNYVNQFNNPSDPDQPFFLIKSGYVKHDPANAGKCGWGAQEHNHIVVPVDNQQQTAVPIRLEKATSDDFFNKDDANRAMMPPACQNHGHDYLGEGSYNRPQARILKVCIKI